MHGLLILHPGCEPEEPRNDSLTPRLLLGKGLAQPSSPKEQAVLLATVAVTWVFSAFVPRAPVR